LGYVPVDPEIKSLTSSAARLFPGFGCTVEEEDPGWTDPGPGHNLIYEASFAARFGERMDERPEWTEPSLRTLIERGRRASGVDLMKAILGRTALYDQAHRFFQSYDLLLTPQMPLVAPVIAADQDDPETLSNERGLAMFDRVAFAFPFNLTGQPAISVPCGLTSAGLPVGLQIVGGWHADATVLRAAGCFEAASPWPQRPPLALA
jgi:Asp-tRNA(Asn)/Glu-tRNA(Gln) amidotransferase A subunit family amidase